MNKTVGIFGGGIAGLSSAHELALAGYNVTIYEMSDSIGGLAKSFRYPDGLPSEYSWRGYGQFYKNVFELMKQIPGPEGNSVYDTELSRPIQFILTRDEPGETIGAYDWMRTFTTTQKSKLLWYMLRELCSDKRMNHYAKINAHDFLKDSIDSYNIKFLTAVFGPWLGIDPKRTSLHHLTNFFRMIQFPDLDKPYLHSADEDGKEWYHGSGSQWLVLKRPTSESWFEPWINYLVNNYNVKIYFNHELHHFNTYSNNIDTATLLANNKFIDVKHDFYISAVTPFAMAKIVKNSNKIIQMDSQLKLFKNLIVDGPHIQVSFRIGFKDKIHTPKKYMAFILPDSEFNLTLYFQDEIWYPYIYLGPGNKTLISGTACISYIPGKLFNRSITDLTEEEFQKEIFYQLYRCKIFNKIIADSNDGKSFKEFPPNVFEIWKGWKFKNNTNDKLEFDEYKWVNSTNTNSYMPEIKTSFSNLFLAGAHVKSSVDLYSMETACATGRDAAFNIINNGQKALQVNKPAWMNFFSSIDNILYEMGLPNVIDVLVMLILVLIIYFVIKNNI